MRTIYSLEDDADIGKIINLCLKKAGYEIFSFETGVSFLEAFKQKKPDMCLLDLMLPDGSGFDIIREIRSDYTNKDLKIIIISAKRMVADKVEGLDLGADDYIEKPFDILELVSRVNARFRTEKQKILTYQDLLLNLDSHQVFVKGKIIDITNTEFTILNCLLSNQSKVISREQLYNLIYSTDQALETRTIDVHVASIRKKISDRQCHIIRTIYGIGYMIG